MTLKDTGCKPQAHGQSDPGGGPCLRCGRPRCCATAKTRDGERCRKNPHPGATICTNHGLTQAGRAKAEEQRQLAYAQEQAARLGKPRVIDPHSVLLEELHDAAGEVAWFAQVVQELGATEMERVELRLWHEARDRRLKAAESCVRAGIEERKQRMAEQTGAQLAGVIRSVLERLGLSPDQQLLARDVVPEELRRLGGDVVAGEVVA